MCQIQYNRKQLLDKYKLVRPDRDTLTLLKSFYLLRYINARGCKKKHPKRIWDTNVGVNLENIKSIPEAVTVVISTRNKKVWKATADLVFIVLQRYILSQKLSYFQMKLRYVTGTI